MQTSYKLPLKSDSEIDFPELLHDIRGMLYCCESSLNLALKKTPSDEQKSLFESALADLKNIPTLIEHFGRKRSL